MDGSGLDEAERLFLESLRINREIGNDRGVAESLSNLGGIALERGDLETAELMFSESLLISRKIGDRSQEAASLDNLARLSQKLGAAVDVGDRFDGDGISAENLEGSNVALGDISQTNIYNGMSPDDYAKLIRRLDRLEDSSSDTVNSDEEEEEEFVPIRETDFYTRSVGLLKEATSLAVTLMILSFLVFGFSDEAFAYATEDEIQQCEDNLIEPGEIHADFEGMTCEEIAGFVSDWTAYDTAFLISVLLFLTALLPLWRPAWNPVRIFDHWVGGLRTPYRTLGVILLAISGLLIVVFSEIPEGSWQEELCGVTCCFTFITGLNLMFISGKFDESGSVSMEPGEDQATGT